MIKPHRLAPAAAWSLFAALTCVAATTASAFDTDELDFDLLLEIKAHYRHSVDNDFRLANPPGAQLETVDPGDHFEVSALTLFTNVDYADSIRIRAKVDIIDRYDRNSSSDDKDIDVDELWLRVGSELPPGRMPDDDSRHMYVKIGKFGKFERQNDRHLESYGLVATAFNRFEDLGIELGSDITENIYVKASVSSGNPVFIRDPNALAGDNGTSDLLDRNDPDLNSGIPILYDAEVEDFQFDDNFAELGIGIGARAGSDDGSRTVDVLLFGYERELKDEVKLFGTHYGGDLDVFSAPDIVNGGQAVLNGLRGSYKREYGASVWVYLDQTTLFGQFVQQDLGGLDRKGWEVELSHRIDIEDWFRIGDTAVLQHLSPAIRYSYLDPNFAGPATFPAPGAFWDWKKIDVGFRVGLFTEMEMTVEYAFNAFTRAGVEENNDEFLTTLRWRHSF